jgi:choline dehydrogenase-like flavoprotein
MTKQTPNRQRQHRNQLAARLSEAPHNKVVLLEAGRDYPPGQTPDDFRDTCSGSALMNPSGAEMSSRLRQTGGHSSPSLRFGRLKQAHSVLLVRQSADLFG